MNTIAPEWRSPPQTPVPDNLRAAVGGHPLVARLLAQRGITTPWQARAFLDPAHYTPSPPGELPGISAAVERLVQAIEAGERICVWGDFDVDGQTSTTLLISALRDLGGTASYHIPVRATESHGIKLGPLEKVIDAGAELILTCDTGIAEHQTIDYARSRGVDVIVTDHHTLPEHLPDACAIVNPQMTATSHPLHDLPGVGVAYKLAEALYQQAGRAAEAEQYLDLVALGIVADVAVQSGDTRYLLQRGLVTLRHTRRLGLQVVCELAKIDLAHLDEQDIGFAIAPRMNALGRLGDANPAVELLTTNDLERARLLATQLEGLNEKRKLLVEQVYQAAESQLQSDPSLLEHAALVLAHPAWPGGIVGLVAGRLAEQYRRPAILITTPPGEIGRGSARSVMGCNITAAIAEHRALLAGFGGHPMAAGLSIAPERIPAFRRGLSQTVAAMMAQAETLPGLQFDGEVSLGEISLDLARDLARLAPFGNGNPNPVLVSRELSLAKHKKIGRQGRHREVTVRDPAGDSQAVMWWYGEGQPLPEGRFDLAYTLAISHFREAPEVQLTWMEARPAASEPPPPAEIAVIDHRRASRPEERLQALCDEAGVVVWREGGADVEGGERQALMPGDTLAIWTTPPGPHVLRAALEQVGPGRVVLFAVDPGLDMIEPFVRRLAGLLKYALNTAGGEVEVARLAAAMAHREATARAGIAWLVAKGVFRLLADNGERLHLAAGDGVQSGLPEAAASLQQLLAETAAYRAYFCTADVSGLLG